MAKTYGKCSLCKINHFLNFAELCKRCSRKKEGIAMIDNAIHEAQLLHEAEKAMQKNQPKVEEKTEETSEEEKSADENKNESTEKSD